MGGLVAIFRKPTSKLVKAIDKNVLWTSYRYGGALIDNIYVPPSELQTAKDVMRSLRWIVCRLFSLEIKPSIVIAGDFNRIAMKTQNSLTN